MMKKNCFVKEKMEKKKAVVHAVGYKPKGNGIKESRVCKDYVFMP